MGGVVAAGHVAEKAARVNGMNGRAESDAPVVSRWELALDEHASPLRFAEIFGRAAPVEVELGCGDGSFLAQLAAATPERDFIGIERLQGRVRRACGHAARRQLGNVRIARLESAFAVKCLLAAGSVARFHLLFPDPWPKRRHHRRRVVNAEFLVSMHSALSNGGTVRIATDQHDYFMQIRELTRASGRFDEANAEPDLPDYPRTTFEKRYLARAVPIYRLELRKSAPPSCGCAVQ